MQQQKPIDLKVSLKGQRNYIQSSDLYLALDSVARERFGPSAWLSSLAFRELIESRCELILSEDGELPALHGQASCTIEVLGNTFTGDIVATGKPISHRTPFDESLIEHSSYISREKISQKHRAGFTAIEEVVGLTKYLLNTILPPKKKRWVFSRIDLKTPFSAADDVCFDVMLSQNLAGRMTISTIQQSGMDIGKIQFVVM